LSAIPSATSSSTQGESAPDIKRSTAWIYGSVSLPLAIMSYPLGVWIPRLYSTEMGFTLEVIGFVIFLAAIFDAISDPLMGFFSDRTRTRWGRRKPWIFVGVPLYAAAIWMLLNPTEGVTVYYLAAFYIALRGTTTIFGLPYTAWGMELSSNYHTRTLIQSAREKFVMIGLMTASAIVLASEEIWNDNSASFVLSNFSWVIVTLLPFTAALVLWKVPEVPEFNPPKISIKESMGKMFKNKLFSRLLVIELLIAGGENFRNTLSLFFCPGLHWRWQGRHLVRDLFRRWPSSHSCLGLDCSQIRQAPITCRCDDFCWHYFHLSFYAGARADYGVLCVVRIERILLWRIRLSATCNVGGRG
jgi:Na+/melibiose symporter-like transporter